MSETDSTGRNDGSQTGQAGLSQEERRKRFTYALDVIMDFRRMNGADLARALHRSPNTIARWKKGLTRPNVDDISSLCEVLGVIPELFVSPPSVPSYPIEEYRRRRVPSEPIGQ
jgi:transcriptional regulator with XRE-family HTH domain